MSLFGGRKTPPVVAEEETAEVEPEKKRFEKKTGDAYKKHLFDPIGTKYQQLIEAGKSNTLLKMREKLRSRGADFTKTDFLSPFNEEQIPHIRHSGLSKHIRQILDILLEVDDFPTIAELTEHTFCNHHSNGTSGSIVSIAQKKDKGTIGYILDIYFEKDIFPTPEELLEGGDEKSVFRLAVSSGVLDDFFQPRFWVDNLDEMEYLWEEKVLFTEQASFDFAAAYAAAKALSHPEPNDVSVAEDDSIDDHLPSTEDQEFLQKLDDISLTAEDLMAPNEDGESLLYKAARYGKFAKALEILDTDGKKLSAEELLDNSSGKSIIEILTAKKQLPLVINEDYWLSRIPELEKVATRIPQEDLNEINYRRIREMANAASLKAFQRGARAI